VLDIRSGGLNGDVAAQLGGPCAYARLAAIANDASRASSSAVHYDFQRSVGTEAEVVP